MSVAYILILENSRVSLNIFKNLNRMRGGVSFDVSYIKYFMIGV